MKLKMLAPVALVLTGLLAGCSDPDVTDTSTTETASSPPPQPETTVDAQKSEEAEEPEEPQGVIIDSGFGQDGQYVWVTALVENQSDHAGQTVTVSYNLLDVDGEIVASTSQVSAFNWAGQTLPVAAQADVGQGTKVDSIESTVLVEDHGTFADTVSDDMGSFEGEIERSEFGTWGAKFKVKNPTQEPLDGASLNVVCRNDGGTIIGGTTVYPELIPASGDYLVQADSLYTEAEPAGCTGFLTPWM